MNETPRGNRVHIGIFGKTNAGKSSLINSITGQNISLVSDVKGTTTDPVYKAMELLPLGPVVFIDTAGIDDTTSIGALRIEKTEEILNKLDLAILLISADSILNSDIKIEKEWKDKILSKNKPIIFAINKLDLVNNNKEFNSKVELVEKDLNLKSIKISAIEKENIDELKRLIVEKAPKMFMEDSLIGDKIKKYDKILLVAPQDIQAPKGRLILPQVQVLRDILDHGGIPTMTTLDNLEESLKMFKPDLVITDSQVFKQVDQVLSSDIPLTSFSIIMARAKGDLEILYQGAKKIDDLKNGDKVLIAEACTHHQLKGDIAREKIPLLLKEKVPELIIENCSGKDYPKNLDEYSLIIHCGSCMLNRSETMSRIEKAQTYDIKITNFGMAIAKLNGILDRVMEIFTK